LLLPPACHSRPEGRVPRRSRPRAPETRVHRSAAVPTVDRGMPEPPPAALSALRRLAPSPARTGGRCPAALTGTLAASDPARHARDRGRTDREWRPRCPAVAGGGRAWPDRGPGGQASATTV